MNWEKEFGHKPPFLLRVLFRADMTLDHLLRPMTLAFMWLTGRSNFPLARWSCLTGTAATVAGYLWEYRNDPGWFDGISVAILGPIWMWIGWNSHNLFSRLERSLENQPDDGTALIPVEFQSILYTRLTYVFLLLFFAPLWLMTPQLSDIGVMLYFVSYYFALHNYPPSGMSVLARTRALARKAANRIKDLVPQPVPAPMPIPIRS